MPGPNENHRNISHHGLKEAAGFVKLVDHPQRAHNDLPPPLRGDAPINAAPHGSTGKLSPKLGKFDRNLTSGTSDEQLKHSANHFPSGRR